MNHCSNCGQALQAGVAFCSGCGASTAHVQQQLTSQQGLAQAGLEVQQFNLLLVVGRVLGLVIGLGVWWFAAGPIFGETQPLLVIVSLFVLAGLGILVGQWMTLMLMRR